MKMTTALTAGLLFATLSLSGGFAGAANLPARGPVSFTAWDTDGSGDIDEQEFNAVREQRQAAAATGCRMGKNRANAPTFAQIDSDGDGRISAGELTAVQQARWHKQGMSRSHQPGNCTGKRNMKYGNQAPDAETREKYAAFFTATSELRQEIALKRAEKRAVMHAAHPDPDEAAQLTRDLLELRSRMMAQAEEAGIDIAPGSGRRCRGM